jgi:hypothetical protein
MGTGTICLDRRESFLEGVGWVKGPQPPDAGRELLEGIGCGDISQ